MPVFLPHIHALVKALPVHKKRDGVLLNPYDFGHVNYALGEIPGIMDVGSSEHCTMREWRVKIALLEDNPSILDYLSRALEMMGHTVHKYSASAALRESLFDGESVHTPLPYVLLLVDL